MPDVIKTPQRTSDHCARHFAVKTDCATCPPAVRTVCHSGPTHRLTVEALNQHILALDAAIGALG